MPAPASPIDLTFTLLVVRHRLIDEATRQAVLAASAGDAPGASARHLVERGHLRVEQARELLGIAQSIEREVARELSASGADPRDPAARQTLVARAVDGILGAQTTHVGGGPAAAGPAPIRRLGRYEVTGTLGAGGMGEVLSVRDPELGREVAAKLVRGRPDPLLIRKFELEARVTGQLEHPSIVPAYELGRTPEGQRYLTMKRVEGVELAVLIERTRRARRESAGERTGVPCGLHRLLQIFGKVCDGVAYAHSRGVIHRDLKPANIMVGEFGEVLVMDWGLAKIVGQGDDPVGAPLALPADAADARQTLAGEVLGTPAYMSPEQAAGRIDALDARTDVYALGAILYELLTLEPPYRGPGARAVLDAVRAGPPPRPAARVAGAWAVPWELEAAVDRAMARRPEERYPDVAALAADVEAFLAGRTLAAADYTPWQRAVKLGRRHWRSLLAVAVAGLSLVGALTHGWLGARREARAVAHERDVARAHARDAESQRGRAEARRREADANLRTATELGAVKTLERLRDEAARTLWWTPAEVREGALTGELAHPPSRARLTAVNAQVAAWEVRAGEKLLSRAAAFGAARRALRHAPDDDWRALRHDIYGQLIAGASELRETARALRGRVARNVARLRRAPDAAAWRAASARIAASPRYRGGLRPGRSAPLVPQVDLVPLGPDPTSRLEEFAHLGSGTPVRRDRGGRLRLADDSGIVFVLIPSGRYTVGAAPPDDPHAHPNEGPARPVVLDAFLLARTELTQAQWAALGGDVNPSKFRAGAFLGRLPLTGRHPVERATWQQCVRLLARHGLQLPTEAQWEAAARGGTATPWWTGADRRALAGAENLADRTAKQGSRSLRHAEDWTDGHMVTAPVALARPNPFGLYDVAGNVREWCRDRFHPRANALDADRQGRRRLEDAPRHDENATPTTAARAMRGGSWTSAAEFCRSSSRAAQPPTFRAQNLGCRASRPLVLEDR